MHATTVKNKITQRDNYKEIMSVIVVVLLLTLTLIAIFSAIDQLSISEMGRIARDLTHFIICKSDSSHRASEIISSRV
ncbi:TPA: Two-protein-system connector protein SafA [Escherichia coli]|nr:Two-protein-system connector protein SafA [Escherichia coli]HAN4457459.1 Two-protein-system connector protein SafA [Escherichia coli]HAN4614661.1 Two-protein-system connector protein SafA [Escherichia coli]HAN4692281.1 Two-protein-system connector protein SafA [Escherichia coli]